VSTTPSFDGLIESRKIAPNIETSCDNHQLKYTSSNKKVTYHDEHIAQEIQSNTEPPEHVSHTDGCLMQSSHRCIVICRRHQQPSQPMASTYSDDVRLLQHPSARPR